MKKVLVCSFVFLLVCFEAFAQQLTDFQWEVTEPSGYVYPYDTVYITGYTGSETDIIIPSEINGMPVVGIDNYAFANKGLSSATIPDSVNIIYYGAFAHNELTDIIIPKASAIWHGAFAYNRLTGITLPDNLQSIGEGAFAHNLLESVTIPESVYSLRAGAFAYNRITSITLHGRPGHIDYATFAGNPITSITIGDIALGWEVFGDDSGFERIYADGGWQAGTYTRPNVESTTWTRHE